MGIDRFGYTGKHVLVVGGATGMGGAAAATAHQMGARGDRDGLRPRHAP